MTTPDSLGDGLEKLPKIYIVGAAGLAREMRQLVHRSQPAWSGETVLIDVADEALMPEGAPAIMAIGHPAARAQAFTRLRQRVNFLTLVHPRADLGDSTTMGVGTIITSGVVTTTQVALGEGVLVNLNSTIGHDAVVGSFCVLNPGVAISGGVTLGTAVLVGTGACILEGRTIGDGAKVGAGAVVTRDVAVGEVVVGAPARPLARTDNT